MPYNAVLTTLLEQLISTDQPVLIGWRTVQQWPVGALKRLLEVGLLVKAPSAESIECRECGGNICYMDIEPGSSGRAFVVCDDPEMQDEMGRINIPLDHLKQWKTSAKLVAKVIAELLDLDYQLDRKKQPANIKLGMLPSRQGRRWVSINVHPLSLEINQRSAPIEEVLYLSFVFGRVDAACAVEDRALGVEVVGGFLEQLGLDGGQGKPYTPSTSKREAGKRKTEAMHQDWHDSYLRLKRQHPDKSETWISEQIEKMPIAMGKAAKTIYRKMKG